MRYHTRENLFKCDICEKEFVLKVCLKRHLKLHASKVRLRYLLQMVTQKCMPTQRVICQRVKARADRIQISVHFIDDIISLNYFRDSTKVRECKTYHPAKGNKISVFLSSPQVDLK